MVGTPTEALALRQIYDLVKSTGSVSAAAKELGIPRNTARHRYKVAMSRLSLPEVRKGEGPSFLVHIPPSPFRTLEELLSHKRKESIRTLAADEAANLVRVDIKTPGPIGLIVFGDPHIDSPGCDFALLERHLELTAARKSYLFAGNAGDLRDNWVGRLSALYAHSTVTSRETLMLVEWMLRGAGVNWLYLVRGNHDCWAGDNDPLDWMMHGAVAYDRPAGVRLALHHPGGQVTRVHTRHDFPGNSIYNPLHALKREVLHGYRDHIIIAGHRHIGADAGDVDGDGRVFQMIRVSGYKRADPYRHEKHLHSAPIHPAALLIIDPTLPDTDRARVWCAPNVKEGCDYLDFKRRKL